MHHGLLGQQSDVWELTPHSGTNFYYHVTSAFWPNGSVNTISNLVGLPTITYGADGEGRMSTVFAGTGQNPVTSVSYNPAVQVTAITYGSLDADSFTYYSTTGRMHTYTYSMGATPKTDSGTLNWNTNGSLQSLTVTDQINSANTQTCNYTHDALGRVASANCGTSIWNQNFAYDPFGNINKTVPNGSTGTSFNVAYDTTNLTNRVITGPYSYTSASDPNAKTGNMTVDASHSYGWDTANRLSTVDPGSSSGVCVTYDALDRVVEQANGSACTSSFTEVVYSPGGAKLALMNASTLTKAFVQLPGGGQAVYNGSGLLYYRHPDWLGSSRLATTPSRACFWDSAYAPFGENYAEPSSGCTTRDLSFTGQNQDTESSASGGPGGLYDFLFRRQSPVQGRWLSPDPAGLAAAHPDDPQSWNRYGYVANNPLALTDPTGLDFCYGSSPYTSGGGGTPQLQVSCLTSLFAIEAYYNWFEGQQAAANAGSGSGGGGASNSPPRSGGVWANNETLGLPGGLNTHPLGLGDLFGLSLGTQCGDFIQCGSLGPWADPFSAGSIAIPIAEGLGKIISVAARVAGVAGVLLSVVFETGDPGGHVDPRKGLPQKMQELLKNCSPGTFCSEPATGSAYVGGVSYEQEYICPAGGVWTIHWIQKGTNIVHGPHIRPGAPRCNGGE